MYYYIEIVEVKTRKRMERKCNWKSSIILYNT